MKRGLQLKPEQEYAGIAALDFLLVWMALPASLLALAASLEIAKFGLGGPGRLLLDAAQHLLLGPFAYTLLWAVSRTDAAKRAQIKPAKAQPAKRQSPFVPLWAAILIAAYVAMCASSAADVWRTLHNPALGWAYKAGIVAAVNLCALALLHVVRLALPRRRAPANRSTVAAPVVLQDSDRPATTAATEIANPLVAGRS